VLPEIGELDALDCLADEPGPAVLDRMEPNPNSVGELHENRVGSLEDGADDRSVAHFFEMKRIGVENFGFLVVGHISSFVMCGLA